MTTSEQVVQRLVGAGDYISVDMTKFLAMGETIGSATWTPNNAALATLVGGSPAVDATGKFVSAKFNFLAAGMVRIDILATTTNPVETHPTFALVEIASPPPTS